MEGVRCTAVKEAIGDGARMGRGFRFRRHLAVGLPVCLAALGVMLLSGCGASSNASVAPTATPAITWTTALPVATGSPARISSTPYFLPTPTAVPTFAVPRGTPIPADKVAMLVNGRPVYLKEWERYREEQMRNIWATQHINPLSYIGQQAMQSKMAYVKSYLVYRELMQPYMDRYHTRMTDAQLRAAEKQLGGAAAFSRALAARRMSLVDYRDQISLQNTVDYIVNHHSYVDDVAHLLEIVTSDAATANAVSVALGKGGDFGAQARAHSLDQSAAGRGGDVGFFAISQLPAPLQQTVRAQPLNVATRPVHAGNYYYILTVLSRQLHAPLTGQNLRNAQSIYWQQWYASQAAAAKIQMFVRLG